jgi:hypothetical protein
MNNEAFLRAIAELTDGDITTITKFANPQTMKDKARLIERLTSLAGSLAEAMTHGK